MIDPKYTLIAKAMYEELVIDYGCCVVLRKLSRIIKILFIGERSAGYYSDLSVYNPLSFAGSYRRYMRSVKLILSRQQHFEPLLFSEMSDN